MIASSDIFFFRPDFFIYSANLIRDNELGRLIIEEVNIVNLMRIPVFNKVLHNENFSGFPITAKFDDDERQRKPNSEFESCVRLQAASNDLTRLHCNGSKLDLMLT